MLDRLRVSERSPLVSVIMPVYDPDPVFFPKAVESILTQHLANVELIIVEDPSPRCAEDALKRISDPRIRYIRNSTRTSLVEQRNRALREARGEFIGLMDADDIAHPFRLVTQVQFLQSHVQIGVVGSNVSVIDASDQTVGYRWFPSLHDDIRNAMTLSVPLCQPSVMMRRDVFDTCGGYVAGSSPVVEDYAYWSRLMHCGIRFANIPEPLLCYRVHGNQIKQSKLRETICGVLSVREQYWSSCSSSRVQMQIALERVALHMPQRLIASLVLWRLWHYIPDPYRRLLGTITRRQPAPLYCNVCRHMPSGGEKRSVRMDARPAKKESARTSGGGLHGDRAGTTTGSLEGEQQPVSNLI